MSLPLFTTGYQGKSVEQLITELREEGVTHLVDVRLNAISRKRGLSKTALSQALRTAGINYLHFRSLGNPRDNRSGYAETDTADARLARQRFKDQLSHADAAEALSELVALCGDPKSKIALFCYEADHRNCHRQQIAEVLNDRISKVLP